MSRISMELGLYKGFRYGFRFMGWFLLEDEILCLNTDINDWKIKNYEKILG